MLIDIDKIIRDPRCQSRTGVDPWLVQEYVVALKEGAVMPPLSTIQAEEGHYIYDGFHRYEAYMRTEAKEIEVETEPGDIWDAIERSCSVNATHGKRRTNEDKRRAVETMLRVMRHRGESWSNREIARRCAVSSRFVDNLVSANGTQIQRPTLVVRNGTAFKMDTSNIGKASRAASVLTDVRTKINAEWAELTAIAESFEDRSTPPPPGTTSLPVDDADFDEEFIDYDRSPSTPEQCQAVVPALEALLLALQRPEDEGREHVTLTEVIEYLTTDADANADDQTWMLTELGELYLNMMRANGARLEALKVLRVKAS
jgi:hypothetical protein